MTNYEYFKDEIIDVIENGHAIALVDGHPMECENTGCGECDFDGRPYGVSCSVCRKQWLNAEHIEKPKLTKKERQFCELVETGWIARDSSGKLYWYEHTPEKALHIWQYVGDVYVCLVKGLRDHFNCQFSFITWDDKEPWSVEELLKLEYEE